ncbi:Protein PHLOEM PROTEIN 2-LIKE A8 [Raphanus sativus]|nr:Protein PHLOEM PROTEIN 2-LIKE A8 [Raphanus sativus]
MASSSVMGQVSTAMQPQVFINFRGSELRRSFIAFLEPAMREANINVFIDELELMGTDLENLLVRIEESKVALAIFSRDYTSSVWCLDELVKIKECKDQRGLKVIPIFYKLEPSVVKYLQGSFGDNFRNLKRNHQHEPLKTQKWEEALTSITETIGMRLPEQSDRSDKEFINSIVEEVKKLLASIPIVEKPPREVKNQSSGLFFVPARRLEITHSENPENWTWSSIYDGQSKADIEVATLIKVYWLHITGNFHTRKLTPGTKYEVVFILNLDDTASGWEEPVTLKLKLEHRGGRQSIQERTLSLDDYIDDGNNWVDIQVGDFEAPPKSAAAKIFFSLHQYVDTDRKDGLVVKGVAIRPKAMDHVTI